MKVVSSLCWKMRPENLPRAKKLGIALLTPFLFKNKLRTIQPQIFEKIKTVSLNLHVRVLIKSVHYLQYSRNVRIEGTQSNSINQVEFLLSQWPCLFQELLDGTFQEIQ